MMASGGRSDMRISQPGLVLTLLLLGASTAAAAPCPQKDRGTLEAWKCFGEVEYTSRSAGEADFGARFVVFANRERLHEKRAPEGVKARLMGEGYALYRGLDRDDSTVIGRHDPFIFFEFALMAPFIALFASESAPSALPLGTTQIMYGGEGKAASFMRELGIRRVKGSVQRTGADYLFTAESLGNVASGFLLMSVSGRWSGVLVEPYPDSMSLSGWQYACPPAGADVRGNHRLVPAGVTLGEVRRGWRGACD
jgi:hypothetical protein